MRICLVLLFSGSLVLFLCTLAPTVTFVDSGELIVAARNLGVAHPPGFPLYLIVSHLATLLPLGNIAQRVHFVSALCAALAVSVLYLVTIECLFSLRARIQRTTSRKKGASVQESFAPERFDYIPGLVSGGMAALSRTLWSYATIAEVYTLNALLIALVLLFMLRWRNRLLVDRKKMKHSPSVIKGRNEDSDLQASPKNTSRDRWLYVAAFLFGLALGVHHVTVALLLPALAFIVYSTVGSQFFRSRRLALVFLAGIIGVSIYLYLPWAASHAPVLNWGNPNTLERFWSHVSGRQYQSNLSLSYDQVQQEIASFFKLASHEFSWPWIPIGLALAVVGLVSLYRRDRVLFGTFAIIISANLLLGLGYQIAEDKDAYYLPLFFLLAVNAGVGVHVFMKTARARDLRLAAGTGAIVILVAFAANLPFNNRHNFFLAEDYVDNIFRGIAPHGLLLTGDWQVVSPMMYFQEIDNRRRDITCIDTLLLKRSWYFGYLEARYPAVMAQSRETIRSYIEDLIRWERDPDLFKKDSALVQRIESHYQEVVRSFIENQASGAPVYATQDVVLSPDPAGQPLAKALGSTYQLVPSGLVFRLYSDRGNHYPNMTSLAMRGLVNGTSSVREDPVVREKVLPVYVTMLVNCGRAFALQGDNVRAMEAYRRAWAIDSSIILERNLLPPGTF